MAKKISYLDNNDNTATLIIELTTDKEELDTIISKASQYYYNARWTDGKTKWDDLTSKEKKGVLLNECARHLGEGAYAQDNDETMNKAKEEMATKKEKYNI